MPASICTECIQFTLHNGEIATPLYALATGARVRSVLARFSPRPSGRRFLCPNDARCPRGTCEMFGGEQQTVEQSAFPIAATRMHHQPCGFIDDQDIVVLIHHQRDFWVWLSSHRRLRLHIQYMCIQSAAERQFHRARLQPLPCPSLSHFCRRRRNSGNISANAASKTLAAG